MTEKAYVIIALIVVLAAIAYSYTLQTTPPASDANTTTTQEPAEQAGDDNRTNTSATEARNEETKEATVKTMAIVVQVGEKVNLAGTWIEVNGLTISQDNQTLQAAVTITLPNMCWNAKPGNATLQDTLLQLTIHLEKKGDICAQALKQQQLTYTLTTRTTPATAEITLVYQDTTGTTETATIQVQIQEQP